MADETDLRCCTDHRRCRRTEERVKKRTQCDALLLLLLLLTALIFWQPAESVRAIDAASRRRSKTVQSGLTVRSSSEGRRLYSSPSFNQFNTTKNGVHRNSNRARASARVRHRPSTPSAGAKRYNASAHAVPSGPNPISN